MHANVGESRSRIRAVSRRKVAGVSPLLLLPYPISRLAVEGWEARAIYRLPLIEDDDLKRSYNRPGAGNRNKRSVLQRRRVTWLFDDGSIKLYKHLMDETALYIPFVSRIRLARHFLTNRGKNKFNGRAQTFDASRARKNSEDICAAPFETSELCAIAGIAFHLSIGLTVINLHHKKRWVSIKRIARPLLELQ